MVNWDNYKLHIEHLLPNFQRIWTSSSCWLSAIMLDICQICPETTFLSLKAQHTGLKKIAFCSGTTDVILSCTFYLQIKMIEPELCSPESYFVECDFLSMTMWHPCTHLAPLPVTVALCNISVTLCHTWDKDLFSVTFDALKYYMGQLGQICTIWFINLVYYPLFTEAWICALIWVKEAQWPSHKLKYSLMRQGPVEHCKI